MKAEEARQKAEEEERKRLEEEAKKAEELKEEVPAEVDMIKVRDKSPGGCQNISKMPSKQQNLPPIIALFMFVYKIIEL